MSPADDHLTLDQRLLPDDLLATFRERAVGYDRDNRFFDETLADLRERGYLRLFVPEELGGLGASVLDVTRLQRRLAGADPAAALGINMHLVVTGAALLATRRGLARARAVLEAAAADELFAFGISEAGNDVMLFDAYSTAEPDGDGGYAVTGTKIFTSMSPAWARLVVHAKVAGTDGGEDQLVFGVLRRGEGVEVLDDWDTHGMRASQSCTTVLRGAPLPAGAVLDHTPVGPTQDPFRFGIFGVFELTVAAVYCGVAERAVEVASGVALTRMSRSKGIVHADDPDIRWRLADAAIGLDGAVLQMEKLAADLDAVFGAGAVGVGGGAGATEAAGGARADGSDRVVGVVGADGAGGGRAPGTTDHGPRWYLQLSGVKSRVTETAIRAVDQCLRASGGRHYSRGSELERLSRDVRAAIYQPSDEESVHASYARGLLGADR